MVFVMLPTVFTRYTNQKEVIWQQYRLCLAIAEYQILGGKQFSYFATICKKIWCLKKVQYLQKKYHCQRTLLRGKQPKWIFHNCGDLLCPLDFLPASRERMVPTEWQVRSVLGDCLCMAKLMSNRAPQYRQYILINDFLDLANLSIREEAICIGHYDRPSLTQVSKVYDCRRPVGPQQMRVIVLKETIDPSRESVGNCKGFFHAYGSPSTLFFAECALPMLYDSPGHPRRQL